MCADGGWGILFGIWRSACIIPYLPPAASASNTIAFVQETVEKGVIGANYTVRVFENPWPWVASVLREYLVLQKVSIRTDSCHVGVFLRVQMLRVVTFTVSANARDEFEDGGCYGYKISLSSFQS